MARKHEDRFTDILISKLKPHPANQELYRQRTPEERDDLARDMEKNGQTEAVEVTEDLLLISGHGRWEAAKQLGWPTLRCWVRSDLTDPDAVMRRLVESNLFRRHQTKLAQMRSFQELMRLEKDLRGQSRGEDEIRGDLRDLVGKRFTPPVSGRTLSRWLRVLKMPMPIQEAVDAGKLKLTDAVKVAAQDGKAQARVAREISEGKPIKEILARHLPKVSEAEITPGKAIQRLRLTLNQAREELSHRVDQIGSKDLFGAVLADLSEGKNLIGEIIQKIKENQRKSLRWLAKLKERAREE